MLKPRTTSSSKIRTARRERGNGTAAKGPLLLLAGGAGGTGGSSFCGCDDGILGSVDCVAEEGTATGGMTFVGCWSATKVVGVIGIFRLTGGDDGMGGTGCLPVVEDGAADVANMVCASCAATRGCERGTVGRGCERIEGGVVGRLPEWREGSLSEGDTIPRIGRRGWLPPAPSSSVSSSSLMSVGSTDGICVPV